jgi:hypothetical protein
MWKHSQHESIEWLREDIGVRPDDHVAYMWYTLAGANGSPVALHLREYVARDMTSTDITKAEQMTRDWKPGDCPSAEHRLGMPGETRSESAKNRQIEFPHNQGCRYVGGIWRCDAPEPEPEVALAIGAGALAGSNSPSEKERDPTRSQAAGALKVGILPPAFLNPSWSTLPDKEEDIYGEIGGFVQSTSTLTVGYDYGARFGFGSLDTHAVWQGSVVKKVPDEAKLRVVGKELGADILVLAWMDNMATRITIVLYVYDIASGKLYQGTDDLARAKGLVASTFALASLPTKGKTVLQ